MCSALSWPRQEAARQEAARQEAARAEAARRESERQESLRQAAAQAEARRQEAERAEAARREAARQAKPTAQRTGGKRDAGASHDDVALVEAMLAHAGPRKAPPPPTEALRQCGADSSPEASVCRARVCVQHPSLPACHTP